MLPNGQEVFELRIPGNKCGLIIGKNGETIKRLGEQYGVKLVVVQETNSASNSDKPLRITGDSERVTRCKEAVLQLIAPKNEGGDDRRSSTNEYGSKSQYQGGGGGVGGGRRADGQAESYIKVPSDKAGIVIGKGKFFIFLLYI
jgi:far upstream element-binding protein